MQLFVRYCKTSTHEDGDREERHSGSADSGLYNSTLNDVRYHLCSQWKNITITAEAQYLCKHKSMVASLPTSVPYGALQGLTELLHSRCFRASADTTGQPWNSLCEVGIQKTW